LKILQINTSDIRGGAALVAWNLHQAFQMEDFNSNLAVNRKYSSDPKVSQMDSKQSSWPTFWKRIAVSRNFRSIPFFPILCNWVAEPMYHARRVLGIEEFNFPTSRDVDIANYDLIHCHVLHGGYFDLRVLMEWSRKRPIVITLHDAWLLAGHCAHSFACEKWLTGCGACPDISIPAALEHDNSALNWKRKRKIFEKSQLYVSAPSQWLLNKAKRSILAKGTRIFRHIEHGVDTSLFRPGDRAFSRAQLGLPENAFIFLFAANGIRKNRWKDFSTLVAAVRQLSATAHNQNVLFVALGQDGQHEDFGSAQIRFVPYVADRVLVASYYAAANVYVHPALAETFPNSIMEAFASGIPVVASAVGGIPEQVAGFIDAGFPELNINLANRANGILVPPENPAALAHALKWLLERPSTAEQLGRQAREHAELRFNLKMQITAYKSWYKEIQSDFQRRLNIDKQE